MWRPCARPLGMFRAGEADVNAGEVVKSTIGQKVSTRTPRWSEGWGQREAGGSGRRGRRGRVSPVTEGEAQGPGCVMPPVEAGRLGRAGESRRARVRVALIQSAGVALAPVQRPSKCTTSATPTPTAPSDAISTAAAAQSFTTRMLG